MAVQTVADELLHSWIRICFCCETSPDARNAGSSRHQMSIVELTLLVSRSSPLTKGCHVSEYAIWKDISSPSGYQHMLHIRVTASRYLTPCHMWKKRDNSKAQFWESVASKSSTDLYDASKNSTKKGLRPFSLILLVKAVKQRSFSPKQSTRGY